MRVLLTGATGQFGSQYQRHTATIAPHDEVTALGHSDLDITNRDSVLQAMGALRPDVVVHAAAWTNVDGCETDPIRAYLANAMGTRFVAEAAELVKARVVYLSSDYVFGGDGGGAGGGLPYTEWDTPDPKSVYGRSKLGGERELTELLGSSATIVRTSWVAGEFGNNFVKTMARLAKDPAASPTVVDDQVGCPTFTADLAATVRTLAVNRLGGIFHASNTGAVSWCSFAKSIFAAMGAKPGRVQPVTTAEYMVGRTAVTAPRPSYSVLDHVALNACGIEMPDWHGSLAVVAAALRA